MLFCKMNDAVFVPEVDKRWIFMQKGVKKNDSAPM